MHLRPRHLLLLGAMVGMPIADLLGSYALLAFAVLAGWTLSDVYRWNRRVVARCTSSKPVDGGSYSDRVPCDGRLTVDGRWLGGCGEPCSFIMDNGRDF